MTAILGISAFYHDSAAALVMDGEIVAAAQEERFSRRKHDARFPVHAIRYCLDEAGLTADELDFVGYYEKPWLKFDRLLETYLSVAPLGYRSFLRALPGWLRHKLHLPSELDRGLGIRHDRRYVFAEHHEAHAASAFFPSPFDEAAILTFDGVGEWATAAYGRGRGNRIVLTHELRFPHSLGLLYSAFTYFCGFRVNSGEYKLMGLAPYGEPRYEQAIREHLIDLKDDGSLRMDMKYFQYCHGTRMTSPRFAKLFGGPPRKPETAITQREMDLAASVQQVAETVLLRAACHVHRQTGLRDLCLAGGVALNCVANGRLLRDGPFERIWIQPAAGDAGGALGTALLIWHQLLDQPRRAEPSDSQQGSLLGPRFPDDRIRGFLDEQGARYREIRDPDRLCAEVVRLLAAGKVVGWMQGRMEFGPRALGSRSILADARDPTMQTTLNQRIKFRESFRPFAPIVLQDRAAQYFELGDCQVSPYMSLTFPVASSQRTPPPVPGVRGLQRVRQIRSTIPAVTHVDCSARIQTVDAARHGLLHRLLAAFERETGCPVLINTSFNVRDEPIVCGPDDAYRCFLATGMDALVIGTCILLREEQPAAESRQQTQVEENQLQPQPPVRWNIENSSDRLFEVNRNPGTAQLRVLGVLWFVACSLLALAGWIELGRPALAAVLVVVGVAVPLIGIWYPPLLRVIFAVLLLVAGPIGMLVSHGLLAGVYYALMTPFGVVMRLLGKDPLCRRFDRQRASYWEERRGSADVESYFRQS